LLLFVVWTLLIQLVDVRAAGQTGTEVGFATLNIWFHELSGVHMKIYTVTDWLGLIPLGVCLLFGSVGLAQLIGRKALWKVDFDILLLGVYYVVVILAYLVFEMLPINYRPILIDGYAEVSYPSSTTMLVLSVMPTLSFQTGRRLKKVWFRKMIRGLSLLFSLGMVMGRLISGVHWLTDIIGALMLSMGLFYSYKGAVLLYGSRRQRD